jgi:hypothetical protein
MKAKNHSLAGWPLMEAPTATSGMCGFNGSAKSGFGDNYDYWFFCLVRGSLWNEKKMREKEMNERERECAGDIREEKGNVLFFL